MFFLEFESSALTFFVLPETVHFVKHWNIPQNIYFRVLLNKFNNSGLEQHEVTLRVTLFYVNGPFKPLSKVVSFNSFFEHF